MEQESIYKNIAVIGCGASGGFVSILLSKNPYNKVTAFDLKEPFSTLLPTGGGRCNLTYDEADVREFVKNYPRGEKFLLSVFSRFGQEKTRKLFEDLGVKTYIQNDKRVFPVSDSSLKTIQTLRKHLSTSNFLYKKEKVVGIVKKENSFVIETNVSNYKFDYVVFSTGGRGNGFDLVSSLGHNIIEAKPSLCALEIKEKFLYDLAGLSFKNVEISFKKGKIKYPVVCGDILFAHKAITGPAIFKVSSLSAFDSFDLENPLALSIRLVDVSKEELELAISSNQKKTIKNLFSMFVPERYVVETLKVHNIQMDKQVSQLKKTEKEILFNSLMSLQINAVKRVPDSEIVTAGGVDLNEVNSKTMQSKLVDNLYFTGEVLNIDAYTGGFNLQNCWSTAYIVSQSLN